MTLTWSEAADLLESFLEEAGRLVDGEELSEVPELGAIQLGDEPDPEVAARVAALLRDTEEALTALSLRKAEIKQELEHTDRLRSAGAGYLRYQ
ncbi:MAG: hypothetical protein ACFCVC_16285 [Acidimicrobiia bacterium]